ncbi:MAG: hypothetical protein Ct9H300mP11_25780 [Chloroflexota bacterium]|nr:MAG: hypothetical protein Ct9H300mP11_25780 [Chloroflexota bacterium]
MGEFVEFKKDSPPPRGFKEVLYPGEIEYNREQQRRKKGKFFVEDETWSQLSGLMKIWTWKRKWASRNNRKQTEGSS